MGEEGVDPVVDQTSSESWRRGGGGRRKGKEESSKARLCEEKELGRGRGSKRGCQQMFCELVDISKKS